MDALLASTAHPPKTAALLTLKLFLRRQFFVENWRASRFSHKRGTNVALDLQNTILARTISVRSPTAP